MAKNMRWARKIGEGILVGQKQKRKKEIKIGKNIWVAKNLKFDLNGFDLKILQIYAIGILFCSSRCVEQNGENEIENGNHMTEINHFNFFALYSGDVAMIGQLSWIGCMLREFIEVDLFI
jgi:hypothetical protein